MNINEIQVDDFGVWHDLTLDELSPGVTVFYGLNGTGKTTLLNVIRTALYGFSEKRCDRYLPPVHGKQASVSLTVSDVSGQFRISRSAPGRYRGGEGTISIHSSQGTKRGKDLLTSMLAGIDEKIFNNVFAVGLSQIQRLASLSNTDAANQLYGLAAGVDRVSIFDVAKKLESQRDAILPATGNAGQIDELLQQKSRIEKELKALQRDSGVFAKMRREYTELSKEIREKERAKRRLDQKGTWTEVAGEIRKHWQRCRQINDRLAEFDPIPDIPRQFAQRVKSSFEKVRDLRRDWEQLSAERKRIKEKAAKYRGRDTLYRHAAEIQALERQRPRLLALVKEVKHGQQSLEELDFEVQAEMEAIGLEAGTPANRLPSLSDDVIQALMAPAREMDVLYERVESSKKMAGMYAEEAKKLKAELETASVRFGGQDIQMTLEKKTALVQSLEDRLGMDQRQESMVRQLEEMEQETAFWLRKTVLPWRGVLTVCAVFSGGVMLMLGGFLHTWFDVITIDHRSSMLIIGFAMAGLSLVMKNAFENNAVERADLCRQQMQTMREEQQQAREEAEDLERALRKSGGGNPDQRLIQAREELAEISQFLPLTQRYQSLTRDAEVAERQTNEAVRQLKEARRAWKASLRSVGLPDNLTPEQIEGMTGRFSDVSRIRNRAQETKRQLGEREQELKGIEERIEQLLDLGQIHPAPQNLADQLTKLSAELEKQSKAGREREELKQRWLHLGENQQRLANSAQQAIAGRQRLLDVQGLAGMADFRQALARGKRTAKYRRERDGRLKKIAKLTDGEYSVKRLQSLLDQRSNALLEKIRQRDRETKVVGSDLEALHQRAGQLKHKLDGQMQDRRVEHKEVALQCLNEKISQLFRQWQRAAMVSSVLDQVRQNYETKRQPVALAEASRHLEHLTQGEYTRVWTPMGQASLCVDDDGQHALPVERLSRGTRELVFLALRFALVSSYNRRGASMPIVLDDVFVNLDDRRAPAVAKVLADLASNGQQILIFTCHERIRRIFRELGNDVRDLPNRKDGHFGTATRLKPLTAEKETSLEHVPAKPESQPKKREMPIQERPAEPQVIEKQVVVEKPVIVEKIVEKVVVTPPEPLVMKETEEVSSLDEIHVEPEASESQPISPIDQFTPAWRDEWLEPLPDLAELEKTDAKQD